MLVTERDVLVDVWVLVIVRGWPATAVVLRIVVVTVASWVAVLNDGVGVDCWAPTREGSTARAAAAASKPRRSFMAGDDSRRATRAVKHVQIGSGRKKRSLKV